MQINSGDNKSKGLKTKDCLHLQHQTCDRNGDIKDEYCMVQNGIRKIPEGKNMDPKYQDILSTVAISKNLLSLPLSVLNSKSVWKDITLQTQWKDSRTNQIVHFSFSRPTNMPFPNSTHAKYLDIMLMLFASKFNDNGVLNFKFSQILELAGQNKYSSGGRVAVVEAINRYRKCHGEWDYSEGGRLCAWNGPIITHCDLWDKDDRISKGNPRNNRDENTWHKVIFHKEIVKALDQQIVKLFFSEVFKNKLTSQELIVYKYFFGFVDNKEVKRSHTKVMNAIGYQSRLSTFIPWITKKCDALVKKNVFEYYKVDNEYVVVKCTHLDSLKDYDNYSDITTPTKEKEAIISNKNVDLLSLYLANKDSVPETLSNAVDSLISLGAKSLYLQLIEEQVLQHIQHIQ